MFKRGLVLLLCLPLAAVAEEREALWQQIGFTATEVLIYTDQLQKLDETECNQGVVVQHSTEQTRERLLQLLPDHDRSRLAGLFDSPMVQNLLNENSLGIESLLSQQQLAEATPGHAKQTLCLELSLSFAENLRQAEDELGELLERYQR